MRMITVAVAGITRNQRKALVEREVVSLAQLAALQLPPTPKIQRIAPLRFSASRTARIQMEGREKRKPVYELIDPERDTYGAARVSFFAFPDR